MTTETISREEIERLGEEFFDAIGVNALHHGFNAAEEVEKWKPVFIQAARVAELESFINGVLGDFLPINPKGKQTKGPVRYLHQRAKKVLGGSYNPQESPSGIAGVHQALKQKERG